MTAPQPPAPAQTPEQAPIQPPRPAPGPAPPENGGQGTAAWPPDEATMLQLMMQARFSIIDEPADEADSVSADQGASSAGSAPPAATPPTPAPPAKE